MYVLGEQPFPEGPHARLRAEGSAHLLEDIREVLADGERTDAECGDILAVAGFVSLGSVVWRRGSCQGE